jgi:hypothetical protein
MSVRTLIAAAAVIAIPIAVTGAEPARKARGNDSTRKICEIRSTTGSRLGAVRVCRTKAEWDEVKAEERGVIERVQNRKALSVN